MTALDRANTDLRHRRTSASCSRWMFGPNWQDGVVSRNAFRSLLWLAFIVSAISAPPTVAAPFGTSAPHAVLLDQTTNTVLFDKGADEPTPPASLGKLMTVAVVFREIR